MGVSCERLPQCVPIVRRIPDIRGEPVCQALRLVVVIPRRSAEQRIVTLAGRHRATVQVLADALAWVAALYIATWWRFDFDLGVWPASRLFTAAVFAVLLQLAAGAGVGLYVGRWRFGSFEEVAAVARGAAIVTAALYVINRFAYQPRLVPVSVGLGGGVLALLFMTGTRYIWRLFIERRMRPSGKDAEPVLVYGAGEGGAQLITAMLRNPKSPIVPVGLLDDSGAKQQLRIMGVPVVGGREAMSRAAAELGARHLIVAIPSASSTLLRELSHLALDTDMKVSVLPAVEEFLGASVALGDIRPLEASDLLGRHEIRTDVAQIAGYLRDKRVLVTGAGGSIGSELCRQIVQFSPERLTMFDRDESALHALQLSIEGRALLEDPNLVVGDIRDIERLAEVFDEHRPQVVFHAAALKHLPLLEMHPNEGMKTNVWGTLNVLRVAEQHAVERFVNVSTDKAADPENVLGYTKRIAERLTAASATRTPGVFLSVRFGNVLGSRGSVLESFRAQIDAGGPVTVTHPEVTRYFMTVEEAVQLVIQAGAVGRDGEALVLDMGEPVLIDDVARRLVAQAERPVAIEYTGLRPGEKMHESLLGVGEMDHRPAHPLISHVPVPPLDVIDLGEPGELRSAAVLSWLRDVGAT